MKQRNPGHVLAPDPPMYHSNQRRRRQRRRLDSHDDEDQQSSFLVDKDGNEYEPYALAWRYLGMYLDCDLDEEKEDDEEEEDEDRRLGSGSRDGGCNRVLLWAAVSTGYVLADPKERENTIVSHFCSFAHDVHVYCSIMIRDTKGVLSESISSTIM